MGGSIYECITFYVQILEVFISFLVFGSLLGSCLPSYFGRNSHSLDNQTSVL